MEDAGEALEAARDAYRRHDWAGARERFRGSGWVGRAQRLLRDAPEGPEHGYALDLEQEAAPGRR